MMADADTQEDTLPTIFLIFGATGDLARRKLIPALCDLYEKGRLPPLLAIIGFARKEMSDEEFQAEVRRICGEGTKHSDEVVEEFSKLFTYQIGRFEDRDGYEKLAKTLGKQDESWNTCANKLYYLAVPPQYYETIFENLYNTGLTESCGPEEGWTRVIVEKPFGKDLTTAQQLDRKLGELFREEQIYRIDHYLGKDTVQNILAFRFSNTFLTPAWNKEAIDSIHIHIFEEDDVADRGGFYDGLGALRDVGQNHMLQLLSLFTMDNPGDFDAESIRRERTRMLEALEVMDVQDVRERTVRGQYRGYAEHKGVDENSTTETYFRVQAHLNDPRWKGVPIHLESGKALGESKVEVTVTFRHERPCLCPPEADKHYTNTLRYRIQPHEGVYTSFWVKKPGPEMTIEQKEFSFDYRHAYEGGEFIDAYTKLLLDAINGDQTMFVSTPEILASWRFIDPIESGWSEDLVPMQMYDVGSMGLPWPPPEQPGATNKQIGYVGLGKMGSNMVKRLIEHGWHVVATDPNEQAREEAEQNGATAVSDTRQLIAELEGPRTIWIMVPHKVVDDVLEELAPHLDENDVIIDGGNSFYKDSIERAKKMEDRGIHFLDIGVSGGPKGALRGSCLMVGGPQDVYKQHMALFSDLAVAGGFDYMGQAGAGHFVKMVHNGIEYGMMQAIAEGFRVMKDWPEQDLDLEKIASVYNHGSVIESRLIGWLRDAYAEYGPELEVISGEVSHSGEGKWTVEAAEELGIPVNVIEDALQFRIDSQDNPSYTGQIVSALRNEFGGHEVKKE